MYKAFCKDRNISSFKNMRSPPHSEEKPINGINWLFQ